MFKIKNVGPKGEDSLSEGDNAQGKLVRLPRELYLDHGIGVAVADGLSSGGGQVFKGNQKLIPIGKLFLLGTGSRGLITYVARKVFGKEYSNPDSLGQKVMNILTSDAISKPEEGTHFIVGGPNYCTDKLEIYRLSVERYGHPQNVGEFAIDGSGSEFLGKVMERDEHRGTKTRGG